MTPSSRCGRMRGPRLVTARRRPAHSLTEAPSWLSCRTPSALRARRAVDWPQPPAHTARPTRTTAACSGRWQGSTTAWARQSTSRPRWSRPDARSGRGAELGHGRRGFGAAQSQSRPDAAGDRSKGLSRISDIVTRSNGDLTRSAVRSGSSARNMKHWGIRDSRPSRAPDPICRTSRETRKARARDQAAEDWADARGRHRDP